MLLTLLLLFAIFLIVSSEYDWRGSFLFTILVGFLQDPIRKTSQIDSSYFAALSLAFFLLTFFLIRLRSNGWDIRIICWPNPVVITTIPIFLYILLLQALNSLARFGDIRLTIVGLLFYLVPLIAIWMGFKIATDLDFLKKVIIVYVVLCSLTAISILANLYGYQSDLFKEVGTGIQITGTGYGYSGFWRTSEIAGWHLATGACFAFILGISETKSIHQIIYFMLSLGLTFLTVSTGRRKSLGLVIIFVALYFLYYSLSSKANKFTRALGSLACVIAILTSSYGLIFSSEVQTKLEPFFNRSSTITLEESQDRLRVQGIGSLIRGIEVAGPLGYGVGVGSNTGTTGIGDARNNIQSLGYISEGGAGRIIIELGVIGSAVFAYLVFQVVILYIRIFSMTNKFLNVNADIVMGLIIFTLANSATFLSASQLYSDPFVLIIIGLSFGSILAIPKIFLETRTISQ
jgi:hypothetical protein